MESRALCLLEKLKEPDLLPASPWQPLFSLWSTSTTHTLPPGTAKLEGHRDSLWLNPKGGIHSDGQPQGVWLSQRAFVNVSGQTSWGLAECDAPAWQFFSYPMGSQWIPVVTITWMKIPNPIHALCHSWKACFPTTQSNQPLALMSHSSMSEQRWSLGT